MTILYKSASGREVRHLSYSAISDYDFCPRLFKLSRIDGYKDKDKRCAFEFGKAVEDGIQFYHANGLKPGDGIDEFKRIWLKWKDIPLIYTKQEKDWSQMYGMGADFLHIYEVKLPTLPIKNAKFQLNYAKPLWPGSDMADLEFTSYIDLLSTLEDGSRVLVDIKCQKSPLDGTPDMVSLDPQLKDYAWASGIRRVGFLWFVKASPSLKKGDSVTLLEDREDWPAGTELEVSRFIEHGESDPMADDLVVAGPAEHVQLMDAELAEIKGKGSTEKKAEVSANYILSGKIRIIPRQNVTKVRLQWVEGTIPEKDLPEAGQQIGNKMIQIKDAYEKSFFPKTGGVRYPNQKCPTCRMRGICLDRKDLVDQMLVKIGPAIDEDAWLKELEEGEESVE